MLLYQYLLDVHCIYYISYDRDVSGDSSARLLDARAVQEPLGREDRTAQREPVIHAGPLREAVLQDVQHHLGLGDTEHLLSIYITVCTLYMIYISYNIYIYL